MPRAGKMHGIDEEIAMSQATTTAPLQWEGGGTSRIPFAVYTDEQLHRKELERLKAKYEGEQADREAYRLLI